MQVYLIRHGESIANRDGIFSGQTDVNLTERGEEQAREISGRINETSFDAVYSSDLIRAWQTAELATKGKYNIDMRKGLREMSFGDYEGKSLKELEDIGSEEFLQWSKDYTNNPVPGGESIVTSGARVMECYKAILKESFEKKHSKIIIFAHLGPIKAIIANEINGDFREHTKFKIDNCGINIIEYDDHGKSFLVCLNAR